MDPWAHYFVGGLNPPFCGGILGAISSVFYSWMKNVIIETLLT